MDTVPTPETDAAMFLLLGEYSAVHVSLSRDLERRLIAMSAVAEKMAEALKVIFDCHDTGHGGEMWYAEEMQTVVEGQREALTANTSLTKPKSA